MNPSICRRLFVLLVVCATQLILTALAPCAAQAQSTVSGQAFGVSVSSLLVNVVDFPEVILDPQGGSASAAAAGLNVVSVITTGAIAADTKASPEHALHDPSIRVGRVGSVRAA